MKWYSVKKYKPPLNQYVIVRADTKYDDPIYFTASWVGFEWDVEVMERICDNDEPNNCIDTIGNDNYIITHFAIPAPVEIEE